MTVLVRYLITYTQNKEDHRLRSAKPRGGRAAATVIDDGSRDGLDVLRIQRARFLFVLAL
jgi:hypothetical protein